MGIPNGFLVGTNPPLLVPANRPGAQQRRYINRVLATRTANLLGYWPLNEPNGGVARDYASGRNGVYGSIQYYGQQGINDGFAPKFDGTTSYVSVYSAALANLWNGALGSIMIWGRVPDAATWVDGQNRYLCQIAYDGNNLIYIRKTSNNNELRCALFAGGVNKAVADARLGGSLNWFQAVMTWDKANDIEAFYVNGLLYGTATGLGTWASPGLLVDGSCSLGANGNNPVLAPAWNGYLAHCAIWNVALTQAEILRLASV